MKRIILFLSLIFLIGGETRAQSYTLVSPCVGTFSRNSLFFDLQTTGNIVLDGFSILSQNCGTRDMKIYYKQGTYLGFNSNPLAWTLIDSTINFNPACLLNCPIPPSFIAINNPLCIPANQTYGFYIAMTNGVGTIESHNLLPSGSIVVQDANVKLITGEGHQGTIPFTIGGTLVTGLSIQGEIHYHLPSFSLGNDTSVCIGDSILLDAGLGMTSYLWSNGATTQTIFVNSSGSYIATVTNCNTLLTDTVYVTAVPCGGIPFVSLSSSDSSFCDKQCIDFFDLSVNNPTSWQWYFPGAVPDTSTAQNPTNICYNNYGSFDVALVACNSDGCDSLFLPGFINEYQNSPNPVITQSGDTLLSTPFYSYQWIEINNPTVVLSTDSIYVTTQPGSYYVLGCDSLGCCTASNVISITGVGELYVAGSMFQIVPNPNNGSFVVTADGIYANEIEISIFNFLGEKIFSSLEKNIANEGIIVKVPSGDLGAGIYLVKIAAGEFAGFQKTIIVR